MYDLSLKQLQEIPWIGKYSSGKDLPCDPPPERIPDLLNLPFRKRPRKYNLFYIWSEIISMVGSEKKRVLDCACGLGQISQALYFKGHDVFACDVTNFFKGGEHIHFIEADLNKEFPYPSESFDVVLISTALHYLDNQIHFFTESKRILKPGGSLIFSAPNLASLHSKRLFVEKGQLFDYSNINRPSVLYAPFFKNYLGNIGFRLESLKGSTALYSRKVLLFKLLNYIYLQKSGSEFENFSSSLIYKFSKTN